MPYKLFILDFKELDNGYNILFYGQREYIQFMPDEHGILTDSNDCTLDQWMYWLKVKGQIY